MKIEINKKAYEKLQKKLPWLYANEINLKGKSGVADLFYKGEYVATAFVNPNSKISARILTFKKESINKEFFYKRIKKAILKRDSLKSITNSYRLIHSEADFLPGLIVDKYEENLIVSFTTFGMDSYKKIIVSILIELLNPKGIYEKGDRIREKEGLEVVSKELYGEVDDEFIIREYDKKFVTFLKRGQKTGFFLDQRKNRKIIGELNVSKTLDLFANAGGFGIYSNSEFVKFVEISDLACDLINKNCALNNVKNFEVVKMDVFKFLEVEKQKYDLIIIDPPAFAKNKHSKKQALKGWKYLIVNSLKILNENGYLALFSCSNAITSKDLLDLALSSSLIEDCYLEVVEFLKQDIDHPYILNIPNSLYLTGVLLRRIK